jgi:hypothetical protein
MRIIGEDETVERFRHSKGIIVLDFCHFSDPLILKNEWKNQGYRKSENEQFCKKRKILNPLQLQRLRICLVGDQGLEPWTP